jgi:nicotinamide phosphoribosyltransferase
MAALALGRLCYNSPMPGFSIPAAEHSTITSWGQDCEAHAYKNMLRQYPEGLVAIVSDSYDIYNACEKIYGEMLRNEILARNGTVVIRPDSGDPLEVLPRVLSILGDKFGTTVNQKGYKVLDPHVRVIQGDGVTPIEINRILLNLDYNGWSADNIAFGMGGGLLQKVDRDTLKCAFKCSEIEMLDGRTRGVWKNPVTDPGKKSKAGKLALLRDHMTGQLFTASKTSDKRLENEVTQTVYENGFVLINDSLDVIRDRVLQPLPAGV